MVELLRRAAEDDDVAGWARSLDPDGIIDLANRYGEYAVRWTHPAPADDGLRPYVPVASPAFKPPSFHYDDEAEELRPTLIASRVFGVASADAGAAAANTGTLARRLKQYLLYCSAVAIDNPLAPIQHAWYGGSGPRVGMPGYQAQVLGDYAALIGEVAPLISGSALILVERPHLQAERALLEALHERTHLGYWEPHELNLATVDYGRVLSLANRTGAYDPYAPPGILQQGLAEARKQCFQIVSEELGWPVHDLPEGDDRGSDRLTLLMDLELPDLDDLPLGDVALVREEGAFADLRTELERALDEALDSGETSREVLKRMIAEALKEPTERLEVKVRRSAALSAVARTGPAKFALGVASADTAYDLAWEAAVEDGTLIEALTSVSRQSVVFAAIAAGWLGYRMWRETMRAEALPEPVTPRGRARAAARRQLCVFGTA
jgi:hypothetical protein